MQSVRTLWPWAMGLFLLLAFTNAGRAATSPLQPAEGQVVLLWISFDGIRPDYLQRVATPSFDRLMAEGAFSRALRPVFPSLTFASHVSMATGVAVRDHGIVANSFFDTATGRDWRFPPFASLLEAEPIWRTARRQDVRTASMDWPLSHAQRGPLATEYHNPRYEARLTDEQRLQQLLDLWRQDEHVQPLRLLMGYAVTVDSPGHRYGPDAPEMAEAIEEMDRLLGWFMEQVLILWREKMRPEDTLYLFLTSDHGMSQVDWIVHPQMAGDLGPEHQVRVVTSGNIAHYYFDRIEPQAARWQAQTQLLAAWAEHAFARAFKREDLPPPWACDHPTRTGDVVVVLDTGYTFGRRAPRAVVEVGEVGGPLGMHGYDPAENPEMDSLGIFWRYPRPLGGLDLGPIHALQLHPTAAAILGIEPAPGAVGAPVLLEVLAGDVPSVQASGHQDR